MKLGSSTEIKTNTVISLISTPGALQTAHYIEIKNAEFSLQCFSGAFRSILPPLLASMQRKCQVLQEFLAFYSTKEVSVDHVVR